MFVSEIPIPWAAYEAKKGDQGDIDKNTPKKWENKPKIIIF